MEEFFSVALEASTKQKPAAAIIGIEKAVQKSGSWITDHTAFPGNIQNFTIETENCKLGLLFDSLVEAGLVFLGDSGEQQLSLIRKGRPDHELRISLNVRFVKIPGEEA